MLYVMFHPFMLDDDDYDITDDWLGSCAGSRFDWVPSAGIESCLHACYVYDLCLMVCSSCGMITIGIVVIANESTVMALELPASLSRIGHLVSVTHASHGSKATYIMRCPLCR